ncbi:MAG: hypothetical protein HS124_06920 [Anaerolineales bacterium]|nr:hypothetical protein [Anaerolineales bacterium]
MMPASLWVHLTGGSLRHFRAFSTPKRNPAFGVLSTPAHPQVTQAVSRLSPKCYQYSQIIVVDFQPTNKEHKEMTLPNNKNANIPDAERVFARMKSYIGPSILVFFLYLLFYFPGLVTNYIYRKEAKRMEHIAEQKLPGTGCLGVMFWLNILNIPLLAVTIIIVLLYALGKTIYKQFSDMKTIKEFAKTLAFIILFVIIIVAESQIEDLRNLHTMNYIDIGPFKVFDHLDLYAMKYIPILLIILGIAINGWLQALIATLKKISVHFVESMSDVWQFINASYQENITST